MNAPLSTTRIAGLLGSRLTPWLVVGVSLSVATLAYLGYRAVDEWQRSATLLADRRAEAAVDLLVQAITRDMRGVQSTVLTSPRRTEAAEEYDLVASAFARYPYPEVFFSARAGSDNVQFYARADRYPAWLPSLGGSTRFPVVPANAPDAARMLMARIAADAERGARYAVFDFTLNTQQYQVVALLSYSEVYRERVTDVFGFLVDRAWVHDHYFGDLTRQVARIAGADTGMALAIRDQDGRTVVGPDQGVSGESAERPFPMLFFDPILVAAKQPPDLSAQSWTARAVAAGDPTLAAANQGARQTLTVAALTTLLLALAFTLMVRAARQSAALAEMRSDFVATVTHELKTPIATIRLATETLASGRVDSLDASRQYAQIAVNQAKRLTRLIDNLLAYSRVTDTTEIYSFEPLAPEQIVDTVVRDFSSKLAEDQFDLHVDVEPSLPPVHADRTAIGLALANLVDNAIRYSGESRYLRIGAHRHEGGVLIAVEDRGVGIPEQELSQVTRKFFRGRHATSGGSGLGLAITQRIVSDHGGTLTLTSRHGEGTVAAITLKASETERPA